MWVVLLRGQQGLGVVLTEEGIELTSENEHFFAVGFTSVSSMQ
jgi:hypothetical protein